MNSKVCILPDIKEIDTYIYSLYLFVYLLKNFINLSSEEKEFIYQDFKDQSQSKLLKKRKGRLTASKLNKSKPGHNHS